VATVDISLKAGLILASQRRPFPIQNKHFGVNKDDSRAKTLEALSLIQKLLAEDGVSFEVNSSKRTR